MDIEAAGAAGGTAENWSRRDGIRAGAVSGPWRSATRPSPAGAANLDGATQVDLMGDIPAPVLRTAAVRSAPMPVPGPVDPGHGRVLLEDDFSDLVADTRMGASPAPAARSSVLGAVLLGGMIACAIVALAFVLRP